MQEESYSRADGESRTDAMGGGMTDEAGRVTGRYVTAVLCPVVLRAELGFKLFCPGCEGSLLVALPQLAPVLLATVGAWVSGHVGCSGSKAGEVVV